jgi:hypothetical protein
MGDACGTYGREDNYTESFGRELKERDNMEDLGTDGSTILK